MPAKNNKANVDAVLAKLFEIAGSKMKDEADKAVLEGLQKYVALA